MTGVRSQNAPERILSDAMQQVHRIGRSETKRAGLSPHALYSTPPALLRFTASLVRHEGLPVTTHLAESHEESQMYQDAAGPLYSWLKTQRAMDDCGGRSPVQQAHQVGLLHPGFIAVHVNHLTPGDAELLAANRCHVVHCPRSHDYFHHKAFPFEELACAGVNICFGTDSLASMRLNKGKLPTLNLWDEMQLFAKNFPTIPPEIIFKMATVNSAQALNLLPDRADLTRLFTSHPKSAAGGSVAGRFEPG
jgi:aminodeoxyfutalosine deaminase